MFIQSTRQPVQTTQPIIKQQTPEQAEQFRPKEDSWLIGQDSFTTAELLDKDS